MGFSFRKSFRIAPGIRVNLSKGGVGISGGVKGLRVGIGPRGTQLTAGRGGFLYRKKLGGFSGQSKATGASGKSSLVPGLMIAIVLLLAVIGLLVWYVLRVRA
jgi:hypothetical protein